MRHSQRGITLIGWIILLVPVAIVVFAGIRLTPIYLNYMSVAKFMSQVATENKDGGATVTAQTLRVSLEKHFNVGYIEHPDIKDIDIHRESGHWVMIADYEDTAPMFGDISLLAQFHKEVQVE